MERKPYAERMAATRAAWPPGPWTGEPDKMEWQHKGVPCLIVRQPDAGHLCGYAAVPPGHPWHGVPMSGLSLTRCEECKRIERRDWEAKDGTPCACGGALVDFDGPQAHGGITYSEKCAGEVCHVAKPGEPDDVWWLGFDCAHAWDTSPTRDYSFAPDAHYRPVEYVKAECEYLAEQILGAAPK